MSGSISRYHSTDLRHGEPLDRINGEGWRPVRGRDDGIQLGCAHGLIDAFCPRQASALGLGGEVAWLAQVAFLLSSFEQFLLEVRHHPGGIDLVEADAPEGLAAGVLCQARPRCPTRRGLPRAPSATLARPVGLRQALQEGFAECHGGPRLLLKLLLHLSDTVFG